MYSTKDMLEGGAVLLVRHETDGDWQYLGTPDPDPDQAVMVHQGHMHQLDPTLEAVKALPIGAWATREDVDGTWTFGEIES
ncbi:hypothetical protein [Blastococcus xanthinilyticus]|uniref:hypothetical protein n=1 Tax=Blastococcus xanthinilyticus TaxID=1564164 RepID=UPI00141277E3|nr:hypothetical protein [Blastococcus xanthinilyticus]